MISELKPTAGNVIEFPAMQLGTTHSKPLSVWETYSCASDRAAGVPP